MEAICEHPALPMASCTGEVRPSAAPMQAHECATGVQPQAVAKLLSRGGFLAAFELNEAAKSRLMPSLLAAFDNKSWASITKLLLRLIYGGGFGQVRPCSSPSVSSLKSIIAPQVLRSESLSGCSGQMHMVFPCIWCMQHLSLKCPVDCVPCRHCIFQVFCTSHQLETCGRVCLALPNVCHFPRTLGAAMGLVTGSPAGAIAAATRAGRGVFAAVPRPAEGRVFLQPGGLRGVPKSPLQHAQLDRYRVRGHDQGAHTRGKALAEVELQVNHDHQSPISTSFLQSESRQESRSITNCVMCR